MSSSQRRLTIYTEGDAVRGLGHLTRCKGYAQHWTRMGGVTRWIVDGDEGARRALAEEDHVQWRRWQADRGPVESTDVALVDSYSADLDVLEAIAAKAGRAIFIDDLFRLPYPQGLVVHSSPGPIDGEQGQARWLTGPRWHPMRKAFWDVAQRGDIRADIGRVLVLAGGVDHRGISGRIARAVADAIPKTRIDLVSGVGAKTPGSLPSNVRLHQGLAASEMRDLMLAADVAVSAAGQTLYELARCGCPTLMFGVADNQRRHMTYWPETGAGRAVGWWDDPALEANILDGLHALSLRDRMVMSQTASQLVDGQGIRRLVAEVTI